MEFGPITALIAAIVTLIIGLFAVRTSRHIAEGKLFSDLICQYSSNKMRKALLFLGGFKTNYGERIEETVRNTNYFKGDPTFRDNLDNSRRVVDHYFSLPIQLHRARFVGPDFVAKFRFLSGSDLWRHVAVPLGKARDSAYDTSVLDEYDRIIKAALLRRQIWDIVMCFRLADVFDAIILHREVNNKRTCAGLDRLRKESVRGASSLSM